MATNLDKLKLFIYDLSVKCCVPQGSILGPLLFIIHMNDLYNVSKFLFYILYTDDTCVLLNGKHQDELIVLINK